MFVLGTEMWGFDLKLNQILVVLILLKVHGLGKEVVISFGIRSFVSLKKAIDIL